MATARELLDQKLVNGEITEEEYDRLIEKLTGKSKRKEITEEGVKKTIEITRLVLSIIGFLSAVYYVYFIISLSTFVLQLPTQSQNAQAIKLIILAVGVVGSIYVGFLQLINIGVRVKYIFIVPAVGYYIITMIFLFLIKNSHSYMSGAGTNSNYEISSLLFIFGIIALISLFISSTIKEAEKAVQANIN